MSNPQIVMNAKWLADAGFAAGDRIQVEVKENQLVIRKLVEDILRPTGFKAGDRITVEAKTDLIVIYSTPEE